MLRHPVAVRPIALTACVTLFSACNSGSDPIAVASLQLTIASTSLQVGQTTQATAVVKDANGNVLTGRTVTWESSAAGVATVAGNGLTAVVTAVAAGTASITVTSEGRSTNAGVTVLAPVATVTLALASNTIGIGQTTQGTATPRDAGSAALAGRTATFASTNPAVATVNPASGLVTAIGAGTTSISATVEGQTGSATLMVCLAAFQPPAAGVTTVHVSATSGSNTTGTGSCAQPFQTITHALTGTTSGAVVRVGPGTHNAALGEVFPIMLPAGVQLIGDEANKGQGAVATRILGGATLTGFTGPCSTYGATIYAGANAVIAGLELTNTLGTFAQMTLLIRNSGITIRNNSIVNSPSGGGSSLYFCNGSTNQVVTGNRIRNNAVTAVAFINGGAGARVEQNVITNNAYGVEYDSPGGDLGGGASGSVGGNVISCNTVNDLWTNTLVTINAANNFWDHVPFAGNDVFNGGGATIISTGAALATPVCP